MELQKSDFTIISSLLVCIHEKLLGILILIPQVLLAYMPLMLLPVYKIRYFICILAYWSHREPLHGKVYSPSHVDNSLA